MFKRAFSSNFNKVAGLTAPPPLSVPNYNVCLTAKATRSPVRTEVDFQELSLLMECQKVALIDVRNIKEVFQYGTIPGAINIPLDEIKSTLELPEEIWYATFHTRKPNRSDPNLIFFARGPNASSAAVEIAHKVGFKKSRQYIGGWEDYCSKLGVPVRKSFAF